MKEYKVKRFKTKEEALAAFDSVPAAGIDVYGWGGKKQHDASARLVLAEDFGFICRMDCAEDGPKSVCREPDGAVCLDSCLEFFVSFDGVSYLNLEANAIGTKCMGFGPGRHGRVPVRDRVPGAFEATPDVRPGRWSMTYELPFEKLAAFYPTIGVEDFAPGTTFTANFYKTGSAEITGAEHYGMWSECLTEHPDFHRPEFFGTCVME